VYYLDDVHHYLDEMDSLATRFPQSVTLFSGQWINTNVFASLANSKGCFMNLAI